MERVKKGEKYWHLYIGSRNITTIEKTDYYNSTDDDYFKHGDYFRTKEDAESMAKKLRAVLNGAEVIEMPSEEEIEKEAVSIALNICGDDYWRDCEEAVHKTTDWLKSKIVK